MDVSREDLRLQPDVCISGQLAQFMRRELYVCCIKRDRWSAEIPQIQRHLSSTSSEDSSSCGLSTPPTAKEYVMSLHQNSRSVLLYGKNNVSVQTVRTICHTACDTI